MLGFFKRWRKRRNRRREIFHYFDGVADRSVDPMRVLRLMAAHPEFSIEKHAPLLDAGDPKAIEITVAAVREIFDLQAFDPLTGDGLTERETLDVLDSFSEWTWSVKKNTNPPQTSPPPTEPASESETITNAGLGST